MLDGVVVALRNVLVAIVEKAKVSDIEQLPTSAVGYSWWDSDLREAGSVLREETYDEPSLRTLFDRIGQGTAADEIATLAESVSAYDREHGWSPQFLHSEWKLIRKYFSLVGNRMTIDDGAIRAAVEQYESAVGNSPYTLLTTVLWRDFSADAEFSLLGDIRFRPIGNEDFKGIGREPRFVGFRHEPLVPYGTDWLCEIREQVPHQGHGTPTEVIQRVISAVSLAVPGRAEARLVATEFENEFLKAGVISNPGWFATSRLGNRIQLHAVDVQKVRDVYALLRNIDESDSLAYLRIPMRRFRSSAARPTDEDMFIDFVIALESLLAPDTENIEVTFRFRLRGAAVLRHETFGSPQDRLDFMNRIYRARSRVVHGQRVQNLRDLATRAESALKEIFMWFATHEAAASGGKSVVSCIDTKMVGALHAPAN